MGSTTHVHVHRLTRPAAALAAIAALAACGGGESSDALASAATAAPAEATAAEAFEAGGGDVAVGDIASGGESPGALAPGDDGAVDLGAVGRDVIIEMHVVLSSDDIERSVASITANAAALGGGVAAAEVNYGGEPTAEQPGGYAVLTVMVPPDRIDQLLAGLDATGEVRSMTQSAQDVTEQLVDLDVRIENAAESVANVRRFMEQTTNLAELVTLEGELTRRQTELEQLEAQRRNLRDRVALSTVTIEIVPTASVPEPESDRGIADAFGDGWAAFKALLFGIAYLAAVLAPFLVLAVVAAAVGIPIWRRRQRRPPAEVGDRVTAPEPEREQVASGSPRE